MGRARPKPQKVRSFWRKNKSNMLCRWCKKSVTKDVPKSQHNFATIDHVVPLSKGGSNRMDNFVVACFECNQERAYIDTKLREGFLG